MLESIITTSETGALTMGSLLICSALSIICGFVIAFCYMYKNQYTRSFVLTLILMPLMIQGVIMLVNGNLGTGVAVMGAFSLVRFRSAPGSAREISAIFLAMAVGLATGTGYVAVAVILLLLSGGLMVALSATGFGSGKSGVKSLKVTIPENLDYGDVFDDVFDGFTKSRELVKVKTTNMGSMFELSYQVELKDPSEEKRFIDALRCRNGNLSITLGRSGDKNEL